MNFGVLIQSRARTELIDGYVWYEEQVSGLGEDFLNEFELVLQFLSINPQLFSPSRNKYREAPFNKFPYLIIYRIDQQKKQIVVLSVFHFSRNPKKKPR